MIKLPTRPTQAGAWYSRHIITVRLLMVLLSACVLNSCKKYSSPAGSVSLTMVHAVSGSRPLAINFSSEGPVQYELGQQLDYKTFFRGENMLLTAYPGPQRLRLFQYPDTTDKDVPLFDMQLNLPIGTINTLFLTGTVEAPDTLLTRDLIPFFSATDSSMAIRFVNLSRGSDPISINLKGLANGSEVNTIAYKNITGFKNYAAISTIPEYVFEFRNAISGDSITSYTITGINEPGDPAPNLRRYRSFTLVLTGEPGGVGDRVQAGFLVSH